MWRIPMEATVAHAHAHLLCGGGHRIPCGKEVHGRDLAVGAVDGLHELVRLLVRLPGQAPHNRAQRQTWH